MKTVVQHLGNLKERAKEKDQWKEIEKEHRYKSREDSKYDVSQRKSILKEMIYSDI